MARYSNSTTKTTGAAAGLIAQLRAANAARDCRLYRVECYATTAVAGLVALTRPTAVGATFTSTAAGAAWDNVSGAGAALIDTAAATAPTIGTVHMKQIQLPATIGAGVIWDFSPWGLVIPAAGAIALWQLSAAAVTYAFSFEYDE